MVLGIAACIEGDWWIPAGWSAGLRGTARGDPALNCGCWGWKGGAWLMLLGPLRGWLLGAYPPRP